MSKTSAKRKSSRTSASIPAVQAEQPRPQPAVQDAVPTMTKPAPAPPPPPPLMSQIASPTEQVGVEQRSSTRPVMAVFLGAAISAFLLALVIVALLGNTEAGRSLGNESTFCCTHEALTVLSVVNSSVGPCEDFYAHVCSRVDAGTADHLLPAFRVTTNRRLLESSTVGTDTTAAGHLLDSLNELLRSGDTPFDQDVADFVTAILGTGLANQRMNSSRMARFFAELSFRYGLPAVIYFTVSKAGTVLHIERSDDCFTGDGYQSMVTPGLRALSKALNVSLTADHLSQAGNNLTKPLRTNATETVSHGPHISPFTSLLESDWTAIMNDLILPAYPNISAVVMQKEDRIDDLFSGLISMSPQHLAIAYVIMCTALTTRDNIDYDAPGQMTDVSCQVLQVCEIEERLLADVVRSNRMDRHIQSVFSKTRADVIQRAKEHPMFKGISEQEITNEMSKLRLILPQGIVVSDLPIPAVSKTFASNLFSARSYIYDVQVAKVARKLPSSDSLFLPSVVRRGDVIYFPTNLYILLNQGPKTIGPLNIPAFGVDMAAQMWSFLLERPWPPKMRANINARLQCLSKYNESTGDDSTKTATAALAVRSAIDDALEPQWNTVKTVNSTKMSVIRLVYLMWVYDMCGSLPGTMSPLAVNTVLRHSPAFGNTFSCPKGSPMTDPVCCLEPC